MLTSLADDNTMSYRAKAPVTAYELSRCPVRSHSWDDDDVAHISVEGLDDSNLDVFYRGLSVMLARNLSRIHMETIRIGALEAFNDRQSVLADQDEIELLRTSAIRTFNLPMNEKLLTSAKCHFRRLPNKNISPKRLSAARDFKDRKMRLIILSANILFDPEFYGPQVGPKSHIIPLRQLHSVSPREHQGQKQYADNLTIDLKVWPIHSNNAAEAELFTYVVTFQDHTTCRNCYELLSQTCKRAETVRVNDQNRPFESPCMAALLERYVYMYI